VKRGTPYSSIPYEKKRFGGLRIVFMVIQLVLTGLCREPGSEAGLPLKRCKRVAFSKLVAAE